MPEAPEVATVVNQLQVFVSWTLIKITQHTSFNVTNQERLNKPYPIKAIRAYAKQIIWDLDDYVILVHLVMEGRFLFQPIGNYHLTLEFTKDGQTKYLYYGDKRTISKFQILTRSEALSEFRHWGPEVMRHQYSGAFWRDRFRNSKRKIHAALLDQELMAGIGNYLAAEILYASRVSPLRSVCDITDTEWEGIARNSYQILNDSYRAGGHTSDSFINPDGQPGGYQVCVYNKTTCPRGYRVDSKTKVNKRTAHWVPEWQR